MKRLLFLCALVLATTVSYSQIISDIEKRGRKNKNDNPFSEKKNWGDAIWSYHASSYRPIGIHVDPGLTYMIGNSPNEPSDGTYELTPSGLPGYYLEFGMEHLFKNYKKIVHYFDWGVGVKHFGGQEKLEIGGTTSRGQFNFGNVFARAAIHNVWQINKYNFIDNSIGANLDYRIYGGNEDPDYAPPGGYNNQNPLVVQLHYALGFGIKVRDGFFIVPTVQTPILTAVQWNGFNPGHTWFQSRYQPTIFTIKFAWLFPKKGCPAVYDNGEGKRSSEQYQMQ
ncbi:hypothetical protein K6119_11780 [Paracrocinitomix mangrovi]|uniref:hypothetical protein n=1 Tax=Paracrocinitomix mangrovi TaxID=2862509 RepID=UPI001C8DC3B8|nr:hypothetical protein [Paracrocinitomix mangrovi]UKN00413.1 hypothetical protein K6119_11780 [Paracrocinitomix mangrovi]